MNPAAKFIFERHLKPFGIVGYDGDEHPFMGTIKIEKGMTEWQVLEKFCVALYAGLEAVLVSHGNTAFL